MKRLNILGTLLAMAAVALVGLAVSCSPSEKADDIKEDVDKGLKEMDQAHAEGLDQSRAEMTADLTKLRIRIADELTKLEADLAKKALKKEKREELEIYRDELVTQRDRIDRNISAVGFATRETWNDVKNETEHIFNDVDAWFARQAEKVDKKTKADHDDDGH